MYYIGVGRNDQGPESGEGTAKRGRGGGRTGGRSSSKKVMERERGGGEEEGGEVEEINSRSLSSLRNHKDERTPLLSSLFSACCVCVCVSVVQQHTHAATHPRFQPTHLVRVRHPTAQPSPPSTRHQTAKAKHPLHSTPVSPTWFGKEGGGREGRERKETLTMEFPPTHNSFSISPLNFPYLPLSR